MASSINTYYAINRTGGECLSEITIKGNRYNGDRGYNRWIPWRNAYKSYCNIYTKDQTGQWWKLSKQGTFHKVSTKKPMPAALRMIDLIGM